MESTSFVFAFSDVILGSVLNSLYSCSTWHFHVAIGFASCFKTRLHRCNWQHSLDRSATWGSLGKDVGVGTCWHKVKEGNCNQVTKCCFLFFFCTFDLEISGSLLDYWLLTMAAVPLLAKTGGPLMVAHRCGAREAPENTLERTLVSYCWLSKSCTSW